MKREFVTAGVFGLVLVLLSAMFVGTANATVETEVLFSDEFNDTEISDSWTTDQTSLFDIDDDQLEITGDTEVTPLGGADALSLVDGFTNDTLTFEFDMKLSELGDFDSLVYAVLFDQDLMDVSDEIYGAYIIIYLDAYVGDETGYVTILYKNASFESGDFPSFIYAIDDAAIDTFYHTSIEINKTADSARIEMANLDTGDLYTKTITDFYEMDDETILDIGFGGLAETPMSMPQQTPMSPMPTENVYGTSVVGYVDNVLVTTEVYVAPPPVVVAVNRAIEISWWMIFFGSVLVIGSYLAWQSFNKNGVDYIRNRDATYVTATVGGLLLAVGAYNYVYQIIKTIPYLFT